MLWTCDSYPHRVVTEGVFVLVVNAQSLLSGLSLFGFDGLCSDGPLREVILFGLLS